MNSINIIGTLVRDVELKFIPSGVAVGKFGIAFNEKIKQNEQWVDKAHFFDVTAWGKTAENINKFFHKGKQIGISGSLQFEQWQDQQSGQNRSKVSIKVDKFDFVGSKQDGQSNNYAPQQQNGYRPNQAAPGYANNGGQEYNANMPQQQGGMEQNIPTIDIDTDEIPF